MEKYWRGMKSAKTCFLWWPRMDQADLHRLWEMKGRGRAGRKVREGEEEQVQMCECSSTAVQRCLQSLRRLEEWFPLLQTAVTDGLSPWQGQPNPCGGHKTEVDSKLQVPSLSVPLSCVSPKDHHSMHPHPSRHPETVPLSLLRLTLHMLYEVK